MPEQRRSTIARLAIGAIMTTGLVAYGGPSDGQSTAEARSALPPERVVAPADAAPPAVRGPADIPENARRGVVLADLRRGRPDGRCPGMLAAPGRAEPACTHGPDPSPPEIDVRAARTTDELTASSVGSSTGVPCYGDGVSGKRVQAIYARSADRADRYASLLPSMRQWAANTDRAFADSAAQTGGVRHLRWVTDAGCDLVVERVQLSVTGDDSFSASIRELQSLGFDRTDRKYLVWVDANLYCGVAALRDDDRPTADNVNNLGPSYTRVDSGCWGLASPIEGHEIMHTLGGVQLSAPHSSGGWHCTDESDLMCYADASGVKLSYDCPSQNERLFDCRHDDYFHTAPPAGSYLANHWNAADSPYLEKGAPATSSTTTAPATTTTSTTAVTTTTTAPPAPSTSTVTFSDSLNRKIQSRSFDITSGSGILSAKLAFSKAPQLTLEVLTAQGTVHATTTGSSPVSLKIPVDAGPYTLVVSGTRSSSFTLEVTHPAP